MGGDDLPLFSIAPFLLIYNALVRYIYVGLEFNKELFNMDESSFNLIIRDKQDGENISLPVPTDKLGSFISGLLGQPQSIERELYGTFNVDHSWLIHIHSILDQRIKQQNHASLIDFKSVVFYENSLKRTLTTLESFEHFSETKKITSQSVRMTWTYLVSFPNKALPEKQEISIYVSSKAPQASKPEDPIRRLVSTKHKVGVISYRVHHTERTWGADIETLIKQEIDNIIEEEPAASVISIIFIFLSFVFIFSGMLIPDFMNSIIQERQIGLLLVDYQKIITLNSASLENLGDKVNLVIELLNPENTLNKVGVVYRFISLFFGIGMAMLCIFLSERQKLSFVVLTKEAEIKRDKLLAKEKRSYIAVIPHLILLFSVLDGDRPF